MNTKKLYRSRSNVIIAGVTAGLADYLQIDVTVVRILFVILTFFNGLGLIIYLAMLILVPVYPIDEPEIIQRKK
jgi:phage shock protein C